MSKLVVAAWLASCAPLPAGITPEQAAQLPPPANHPVSFSKEIKPIFEASCIKCHGRGKNKGGFRLDDRQTLLKGGESGPAIVPGKSAESLLISLVQGLDPDSVMPKKGSRLTAEQISLPARRIQQGRQAPTPPSCCAANRERCFGMTLSTSARHTAELQP